MPMAANLLAPVLKLSQKVINNRGVVTSDLALNGALTVSGPADGTIFVYFNRLVQESSEEFDVVVQVASGATPKSIKLSKSDLKLLGNQKISAVAVYVKDDIAETSEFIEFTLDTRTATPVAAPVLTAPTQSQRNGKTRIDWYGTSTDLADGLQLNLRMMEGALNSANQSLDIFAFWDQSSQSTFTTGGGQQNPWPSVGSSFLKPNSSALDPVLRPGLNRNPLVETELLTTKFNLRPELDTGYYQSLKTFLATASASNSGNYGNKMLVLSGHGGGIIGGTNPDGPAYDDAPASGDTISSSQLIDALSSLPSGSRYDLVGFDECLMGSVELAYNLKSVAKYLLASEESIAGNGWDYFAALSRLQNGTSTAVVGKKFVDSFRAGYGDTPIIGEANTLALTDLGQMDNVAQKISSFVSSIIAEKSPQFWSAIGKSLLAGTYYGGDDYGYYQDLAGFVARVGLIPKASLQTKNAVNSLLDALGKAVIQNTIKSDNRLLLPRSGMKPVARASYGLSVVLPYNLNSYKNLLGEDPISMREFVNGWYQTQAGHFLQKSGWAKLLIALDERKCFLNEKSPFRFNAADQARSALNQQRYTDSDSLEFYLSTFDYVYNVTGDPYEYASLNSLGIVNNFLSAPAAKVKLENLTIIVDPTIADREGYQAVINIEIWDEKLKQVLASFKEKANSPISLDLARLLSPGLKTLIVSPSLKLRVSTDHEDGVAFASQIKLNGNPMALPSLGFDKSSPIKLPGEESFAAAQILDQSSPERFYSFVSDRSPSAVSIELNSVMQASDLVLAITENPDAKDAVTMRREGSSSLVQTFLPKPSTEYLINVYKSKPNDTSSNDFAINKGSATDHHLLSSLTPTLLSLNLEFAKQGEVVVESTPTREGGRYANFFVDAAESNVKFYADSLSPSESVLLSSVTSTSATNALSRQRVSQFHDGTSAQELLKLLKSSSGKSIGQGASAKINLNALSSSFALSCVVNSKATQTYRSTDASVISSEAEEDTSMIFGNGTQISMDSGVYQLPKDEKSYQLSFVAANGRQSSGQLSNKPIDTLFFYKVDSITGALFESGHWIKPGDATYAEYALKRASARDWSVSLSPSSALDASKLIDCSQIAMGLLVNGSVGDALVRNPRNQMPMSQSSLPYTLFSVPAANPDGSSRLISLGNSCFSFESGLSLANADFADLMVRFDGRSLV